MSPTRSTNARSTCAATRSTAWSSTRSASATRRRPRSRTGSAFVQRVIHPKHKVTIAVAGKYIELQDAYKSIYESLIHAGAHHDTKVRSSASIPEAIEDHGAKAVIGEVDGILVPGGFGDRGIEGKIAAARYARENKIPYFGICLGMQIATIEFARNVCGLRRGELDRVRQGHQIPGHLPAGRTEGHRGHGRHHAPRLLRVDPVRRHQGRRTLWQRGPHPRAPPPPLRVQLRLSGQLQEAGLVISSVSAKEGLVEIIELPDHPFYVGAQFHPEFQSKPNHPHPLFSGFVAAALEHKMA
jgi:CTP synthase